MRVVGRFRGRADGGDAIGWNNDGGAGSGLMSQFSGKIVVFRLFIDA